MKKHLLLFCLGFLLSALNAYSQPPKIDIISINGPCAGPTLPYRIELGVQFKNGYEDMTLILHWGDGSSNRFSPIPQGTGVAAAHDYGMSGNYTIKFVLYDSTDVAVDSTMYAASTFCEYLYGSIYKRNDANCTFNEGIDDHISIPVKLRLDKNNIPQDTIVGTSTFALKIGALDSTAEYSLQLIQTPPGYVAACPSGGQYIFRVDTITGTWRPQFGLDCNTSNTRPDLYAYMNTLLRFVNTSYLTIAAGNAACTSQDAIVTLELSPKYTFNSASTAPSSINGQILSWELKNLKGGDHEYITLSLDPVGKLTPGDTSCNTLHITPLAGDANPEDNSYTSCDSIRASWDPNDKKVVPAGEIAPGTELTYTINFENLGNDTAFNIHILDTLSNHLQHSSLAVIFSSHLVKISFNDVANPKVARFEFQNIRLADKNSPAHNKGTLIYKIKAKEDLPPGATIENTAHIFFDINPAVVTNTTQSTIGEGSKIRTTATIAAPHLYPNPVGDQLYLDNPSAQLDRMMIINILGQTVHQRKIKGGINIISTATLTPGIYYIKLSGAYETRPVKIIRK